MYKQDYKIVISADINGEIYWQMFRKGESIFPTKKSAIVEKSKNQKHIPSIVKWAYEKD